jgi:hypothetical protein
MDKARDLLHLVEAHVVRAIQEGRTIEGVFGNALVRIMKARLEQDTTDRVMMTLCRRCGASGDQGT